jgi:TetR/AcrR family transcriptional regulator, transcriptional repressor for nem operon
MRVSKVKAAQNRQDILIAAGRLFREQGVRATGVDAIADAVDLTHGAIYSQFGSKEIIAVEAIRLALMRSTQRWQRMAKRERPKKAFPAIVTNYLSVAHRDAVGQGCVVAALASEIGRQPESIRDAFTDELKDAIEFLAEVMRGDDSSCSSDDAIAALTSMAGAVILARAVSDRELSDRILETTAKRVLDRARHQRTANLKSRR